MSASADEIDIVVVSANNVAQQSGWVERRARERPETLFVAPAIALFRRGPVVVRTGRATARIVLALAGRPGRPLDLGETIEILYGDRSDGGPNCVRSCVERKLTEARAALAALHYATRCEHGRGVEAWRLPP